MPGAQAPDWRSVSSLILEHIDKPALLLARDGTIALVNEALEQLCGARRGSLAGQPWDYLFTPPDDLNIAELESPIHTRFISGKAFARRYEFGLRISPPTSGTSAPILVQIDDQCAVGSASFNCCTYVISSAPNTLGRLLSLNLHFPTGNTDLTGQCYRVLHGAPAPCDGCPVFEDGLHVPSRHVVVPNSTTRGHRLIETSKVDAVKMEIRSVSVSDDVLGDLVHSRIRRIAKEAELTDREVEVLDLLYVGRATRDIAMVLQISERTVKYHQANVLRKVGADNRVDLIRLLL